MPMTLTLLRVKSDEREERLERDGSCAGEIVKVVEDKNTGVYMRYARQL